MRNNYSLEKELRKEKIKNSEEKSQKAISTLIPLENSIENIWKDLEILDSYLKLNNIDAESQIPGYIEKLNDAKVSLAKYTESVKRAIIEKEGEGYEEKLFLMSEDYPVLKYLNNENGSSKKSLKFVLKRLFL